MGSSPLQLTIVEYSCSCSLPELLDCDSAAGLPSLSLLTACRVLAMVLRGICLMRPSEISWMYRGGVAHLQPSGEWVHSARLLCGPVEISWLAYGWLGSSAASRCSTAHEMLTCCNYHCRVTLLHHSPPRDGLSACMVVQSLMYA